jgi:hypothetical protein
VEIEPFGEEEIMISPLFGRNQTAQALVEVLEDDRLITSREMSRMEYRHYVGAEPTLKITVRVQQEKEPPFEAGRQAGLSSMFWLIQDDTSGITRRLPCSVNPCNWM